MLKYINGNSLSEIYPNVILALKILLTIPVTVVMAEWLLLEQDIKKNYLMNG